MSTVIAPNGHLVLLKRLVNRFSHPGSLNGRQQEIYQWVHGPKKCRANAKIKEQLLEGVVHYSCSRCRILKARQFTADEIIAMNAIQHDLQCCRDLPPKFVRLEWSKQIVIKCRCCDGLVSIFALDGIKLRDDQISTT